MNIFIIHGSNGSPTENWFPWLKKELQTLGHNVIVPQFQVPKVEMARGHKLNEWLKKMEQYKEFIDESTILVAHSRGCVFTYQFLPTLRTPIKAAFLVGPWLKYRWYLDQPGVDSFHEKPFNWSKIRQSCHYFEVYQSTNDETPVEEGKEIAKNLQGNIIVVENAGHFNVSSKPEYKEFPLLLTNIKKHLT